MPERRIGPKTLFGLVKSAFGVVAGAPWQRKRVDGHGVPREATCLHTEYFTAPAGLRRGAPGGSRTLAGLADDAPPANCAGPAPTSCAPSLTRTAPHRTGSAEAGRRRRRPW
nr:hypothetical protein OG999_00500 [Streptomyces sp. NBC_00886]WSY57483.1 hypothetical protein OG999_50090 [Streptomyces sp. NBC_00886]